MTTTDYSDLAGTKALAQNLARVTRVPTHVVNQDGRYLVQDETDISCYGGRDAIVATFDPPPPPPEPDDNPDIDTTPETEGPSPLRRPHAVTLQSIQIEQTMRRCHNCGADHRTWACPDIRAALFAPTEPTPWSDPDLGRELCRMKWQNFRGFVALLLSVPTAHLVIYAASYQAFIRSHKPDSDVTINEILQVWARDIRRGGDRGPGLAQQVAV